MKHIILILAHCIVTEIALGQTKTMSSREAMRHINETVIIQDTVKGYKIIKSGFALLDLGARYPNQIMTVVLKGENFKYDPANLIGHQIQVEGKLELYRDKPEIVVTDRNKFLVE